MDSDTAAPSVPAAAPAATPAVDEARPTGNLTFDEKLVHKHGAEPLEGHTVVVLERVGEVGERFHSALEPGDDRPLGSFFRKLIGKPDQFVAYAVDAAKSRVLSFTERVEMTDRAHELDLELSLWYRAGDPQLLVSLRATDPLGRVRRRVAEMVTDEFADQRWADVWHSPRVAGENVVSQVLGELRGFARDFGIAIVSLGLKAKLPPEATATEKAIFQAGEDGRLAIQRATVDETVRVHRQGLARDNAALDDEERERNRVRGREDALHQATTEKLAQLLQSAGTVYELEEVHGRLGTARSTGLPEIGPGAGYARLPGARGGDGFAGVLQDVAALTDELQQGPRCKARVALLRLVAAVLDDGVGDSGGDEAVFARQVREAAAASAGLPPTQARDLALLADVKELRTRLSA